MESVAHFIKRFIPDNYNLFLDINRQEKIFTGNVAISGEALDNRVSLHQKDLKISAILLDNHPLEFEMDDKNEAVHIDLPETGSMTLLVEFSGKITDNMTGIYPSYYTVDGVKKEVIATQFESHFAREAFPSIDEPEAKATFDLSIKFDQLPDDIVLSNMPEIDHKRRQETGIWTFETTPRMSSYLLAFALGELQGKTATSQNGTEVGVFSTKAHALNTLDFALDIAVRVIDFYEDYYGIHYPIPLSYHLALPDFSSGAMENWGLVTYRELYLLVDENSTVKSRQNVALVVAHELAHQWFGNLVTMKWWDDLWLNESFANMMEYVAIDAIEPNWNIFEDFQTTGIPLALRRDATDGVQSVHVAVNHPDEIDTLFDPAIVYAKGSRLMHMLHRWLGDRAFRAGLQSYFEKHQYSNTIGRDLWSALGDSSQKDVADFMDSWLEQPGYPVLTAEVVNDTLILTQEQFFIGEGEAKNRLWQIPLNSTWTGLPDTLVDERLEIPNFSQLAAVNKGALRFNTENTAHYITHYKGELLGAIFEELASYDAISKSQFIQENCLLAEGGKIAYADLVPVLLRLKGESSYLVVSAISTLVRGLRLFLDENSSASEEFKAIISHILQANYERLGFTVKPTDTDEDELVRQQIISLMLYAEHPQAIAEAEAIFSNYQENLEQIPASLRLAVLSNQMKQAESEELVSSYLAAYTQTTNASFRDQLALALSETNSVATINRILAVLKDKDVIKPQDVAMSWYLPFLRREFTRSHVWDWACNNWDWLKKILGGDMSFEKFVIYPANYFKTEAEYDAYKAFFEPKLADIGITRTITMGIKEISARIRLIQSEKQNVEEAIKAYHQTI